MSGGLLTRYSRKSVSPEQRAAQFVQSEPRLTWTALFFAAFPEGEIYLVGGTLRDTLLGRKPNDIDLVIRNVEPDVLEGWLLRHGAAEFVGRFGTFKFVPHGTGRKGPIDIALPRTEHIGMNHRGGRRDMEVAFDHTLSISEDLSRRDFTINAMAYNIGDERLIDPFLGLTDLYNEVISAVLVPEQRFHEDATRMLRGLRLASQLGFGIESHTWRAIAANIELLNQTDITEAGIHRFLVPREAVGKEFLLGFMHHPVHTLRLWSESKALHLFMPQLAALENVIEHDNQTAFNKTTSILHSLHKKSLLKGYGLKSASPTLLVAALMTFLDQEKSRNAKEICLQLHFHQFDTKHDAYVNCSDVFWLLEHLDDFADMDPATVRPSVFEKRFMNKRGRELLVLMHAVSIAQGKHSVARERIHTALRIVQHLEKRVDQEGVNGHLPRLVSGKDIQALGINPGPAYRDLLDQIRDAQWMQEVDSKTDAQNLLRKLVSKM